MTERTNSQDAAPSEQQLLIQAQVGRYLRKLRGKQKQAVVAAKAGIHERTYGDIERGKTDFQLSTLMKAIDAVGGTVPEAFRSYIPRTLHNTSHQPWHEMLQLILTSGNEDEIRLLQRALRNAYALTVADTRPDEAP